MQNVGGSSLVYTSSLPKTREKEAWVLLVSIIATSNHSMCLLFYQTFYIEN